MPHAAQFAQIARLYEGEEKQHRKKKPEIIEKNPTVSDAFISATVILPTIPPPRSISTPPTSTAAPVILPTRPPPQSMLPLVGASLPTHSEGNEDGHNFHEVQATLVPNEPVYDAAPITIVPWRKRNKITIAVGLISVVAFVAAL